MADDAVDDSQAKPPVPSEPAGPVEADRVPRPARILTVGPYVLIAFLYLATSPYHRGLNNPNEMVRVYMSKAWVETGSFVIQPVIREWGMVDDKALRDGRLYSSKAPLQSLVGIPAYAGAPAILGATGAPIDKRTITWVLRILGSALFGIGFAWVLLAWCQRRASEWGVRGSLGTALGLALALGTMIYPYSITFTGHGIAALAAGGCYLAVVGLSRAPPGNRTWIAMALLAGFLGGAAPFSEYPSALVAGPALVAAFVLTEGWRRRAQLFGWFALGGAAPFGLGLWAHWKLWGHPFRTGYTYLENKSYVEVHGEGFFGVSFPKADALFGALFSPGTGLFFFSPILLAGVAAIVVGLRAPRAVTSDRGYAVGPRPLPRSLAVAAAVAFLASYYFISAHKGWRGGWTVGPRYIVAVAPLLGIWAVEAVRWPRARSVIAGLAALSITSTGFAAALYPHLSDVYTNPLATFVWPSYVSGEITYGLAHTLGFSGAAANAVHALPLLATVVFCLIAGAQAAGRPAVGGIVTLVPMVLGLALIALIPERDADAARRENRRLWGFWEPAGPGDGPMSARRLNRPGRVFRARTAYRRIRVEADGEDQPRVCGPFRGKFCRYGSQPWQRFGPEQITMAGIPEDVLFLHPIAGRAVRVTIPVQAKAELFVLRYGMADASVHADNPHLIELVIRQGERLLAEQTVYRTAGLKTLELALTSTDAVTVELRVEQDGARVFGFDVEQYH